MHRLRAWGLSAVLAGVGTPALAADPPPPNTLANKLFGPKKPKPAGPTVGSAPVAAMKPPAASATLAPDTLAAAVQAEQEAWSRRMDVILNLRKVAFDTNNDALGKQADDLERQATALYNARVAALGAPKVKAPLPEAALDRQLGTGVAVNPLTVLPAAAPATGTAALKAPAAPVPSDTIREVKP